MKKENFIYIDVNQLSNTCFKLKCTCGDSVSVEVIFENIDLRREESKAFCIYSFEDLENRKITIKFKGFHSIFCLWRCSRCHEEERMIINYCNLMAQQRQIPFGISNVRESIFKK